jgi:hypothetical protein
MNTSVTKPATVSIGVIAELTAGGESVNLQLEQTTEAGIKVLRGGMLPGQRLRLVALLEAIIPEIPPLDSMRQLAITELRLELRPTLKTTAFQVGIANVWSLQLETSDPQKPLNLSIDSLFVAIKQAPQEKSILLQGEFSLFGGTFSLSVQRLVSTAGRSSNQWILRARAERIPLDILVNHLLGAGKLTADFQLQDLRIDRLELELRRSQTGGITQSQYSFRGAMTWRFRIADEEFAIAASADITYQNQRIGGKVAGTLALLNESVQTTIFYEFSPQTSNTTEKRVGFEITIKSLGIQGVYSNTGGVERITFNFIGSFTVGDLLSYVVSLFDPSLEDFELDPPWDGLTRESIEPSLLVVEINLTRRQFTFSYAKTLDFGIFKISNLGLSYGRLPNSNQYRPNLSLELTIPGQPRQRVAWDPVNENPPSIPGKGVQIFDLQFLAIGQRVTFHPDIVAQARNITQVMTVLRQTMGVLPPAQRRQNPLEALQARLPSPAPVSIDPTATITIPEGSSPIVFNPNSDILLGAQFSIMDTLDLSVIFNDPLIYGMRISLYGAKAKLFSGLQFEILYRRVSDTVGVYHVELALPEAMRQFDVGALAVTLPVVVVDIYTNGDFAIDFGFPWKGDFTRSFAIQGFAGPFPVLGFGGFYFAKLSAETATSTPVISNGNFSPVYEFGLGLKIGLGRTFNKGPLKAEISITIHGVIQGVVARFNPSDPTVASDDYFKIQGGVSLVGRLYGVVDFGVISVEVEVLIRATVLFVVEAYQPTEIILEAEVSVRASVKVLFIRVRFSFSLTVRQSFTLGSASPTPWKLGTPETANRQAARFAPAAFRMPVIFDQVVDTPEILEAPAFRTLDMAAFTTADGGIPAVLETPEGLPFPVRREAASSTDRFWPAEALPLPNNLSPEQKYSYDLELRFLTRIADLALLPTSEQSLMIVARVRDETDPDQIEDFYTVRIFDDQGIRTVDSRQGTFNPSPDLVKKLNGALINRPDRRAEAELIAEILSTIGHTPKERIRIDLYFQPGFTQVSQTVAGVGLLFIENSIREDDPAKLGASASQVDTDFDALVTALLKWTVYHYRREILTPQAIPSHNMPLEDWEDIYARFIKDFETANSIPGFLTQLYLFLETNFVFELSDLELSEDQELLSGTFFPMLPQLGMTLNEEAPINFQDDDFQRSLAQIQQIKNYFKVLQVRPGSTLENSAPGVNPSEPVSVGTIHLSLTDYLFADYFLLLIRSGLQRAIDYLEDLPVLDSLSVESVLDGLNRNGAFNHLAGMASRYFLHGLRLPELAKDSLAQNPETTALYIATGQQFEVPFENNRTNLSQIKLSKISDLPWVHFVDYDQTNRENPPARNAETLIYSLRDTQRNFLRQLKTATPQSVLNEQTEFLPFYKPAPRQYTLRQCSDLVRRDLDNPQSVSIHELRELPADLRAYLQSNPSGQGIPFTLTDATDKTALPLDLNQVLWSTKINVTVRKLPTRNVYQLEGTDEVGKDLLETILAKQAISKLDLLYLEPDTRQLLQPTRDVLLLKTNLSTRSQSATTTTLSMTATNPAAIYQAVLPGEAEDGTDFLQLLWECSTVNSGGYYIDYRQADGTGLPDALFADGVTADLVLVIRVTGSIQTAYPFHNCVEITATLGTDLLATRDDEADPVQVLQLPAGHLGIQLTRLYLEVDPKNDTANDELGHLYQLLGYRFLEQAGEFVASPEGLPIGPNDDGVAGDKPLWHYERVIPVYKLAVVNIPQQPDKTLPSPEMNPYLGVGAAVKPQMEWRDLYGNIFKTFEPDPIPVRYFDPLLGLNQWPSLLERYRFSQGQSGERVDQNSVLLNLSLQLDAHAYIPTPDNPLEEVQRKVHAARETYQQIYYQVHQPDVTATVQTSVLLTGGKPVQKAVDKIILTGFVDMAYRYLSALEDLKLQTYPVEDNETFTTVANRFRLSVDALATENQYLPGVWEPGTTLEIPVDRDIIPGDSLDAIALEALRTEALLRQGKSVRAIATTATLPSFSDTQIAEKRQQIITRHRNTPGLVKDQRSIATPGQASYTTQPGESLTQIANATGQTVATLVASLETEGDYLDDRITLSVPLTYRFQPTDSLADIRDRVKAALNHQTLSIDLDADLLTVADIALATDAVLKANTTLTLPGQLRQPDGSSTSTHTVTAEETTLRQLMVTLNQPFATDPLKQVDLAALVTTNQTLAGLIKPAVSLQTAFVSWLALDENVPVALRSHVQPFLAAATADVLTREDETFYSLTGVFEQVRQSLREALDQAPEPENPLFKAQVQQLRSQLSRTASLAEVAISLQDLPLLNPGATLIKPPYTAQIPLILDLPTAGNAVTYPDQLIFPVTVQMTLTRDDTLVSQAVPDRTLVREATAYLSPQTAEGDARSASLKPFAQAFQATFPGLRLATSDHRNPGFPGDPNGPSQSIWAVRLGPGGLTYNILQQKPLFFAPAPLTNTLMGGLVKLSNGESKRFDAIDLNLLGQQCLQAIEDFLSPAVSIPALRLGATESVNAILTAKDALAEAISRQVVSLLQPALPANDPRQQQAAAALKQELQINLAAAYAIETIVQYGVSVANILPDEGDFPVRLAGQPTLVSAQDATNHTALDLSTLDFTLSPTKVSLGPESYLTFFFNTQNPQIYEDIELTLTFNSNELEYNIQDQTTAGIAGYQKSDWLSFIVQDTPDELGTVQIPIPLRTYPVSPSLVLQQVQLDPDAIGDDLANVREWQYVYTYEHLDVAQDSLESDVRYNLTGLPQPAQLGFIEDGENETLFDALVRFNQAYPLLQAIFKQLATEDQTPDDPSGAIAEFAELVSTVAQTWLDWFPVQRSLVPTAVDYTINEEDPPDQPAIKEVTIVARDTVTLPQVLLPGYRSLGITPQTAPAGLQQQLYRFEAKSPAAAALDPVFGESSIPDRTLIIQDRDIITHQNAWSGIWLTRNRQLVPYAQTNPVFVFQTPQVRFSNWVTPLLVNHRPWNLATLSDSPRQSILTHLQRLFATVLPATAPNPTAYD